MLVFVEGGKPENPPKNPQSGHKIQQQTQPMASTPGIDPLHHPCSPVRYLHYKVIKSALFQTKEIHYHPLLSHVVCITEMFTGFHLNKRLQITEFDFYIYFYLFIYLFHHTLFTKKKKI